MSFNELPIRYKVSHNDNAHENRQQKKDRLSPQWWSVSSTSAHILFDLHSLIWGYQSYSIDSFVNLQTFDCNLKGGLFDPLHVLRGQGGREGLGMGPFDSPLMGSY